MKKLAHVVLLEKLHAAIDMLLEELDQETPDEGMVQALETKIGVYCELLGEMKIADGDTEIVAKELGVMADSLDDTEYFADMKAMLGNTAAMVMPTDDDEVESGTGEGNDDGTTDGEVLPEEDLSDGTGEGGDEKSAT